VECIARWERRSSGWNSHSIKSVNYLLRSHKRLIVTFQSFKRVELPPSLPKVFTVFDEIDVEVVTEN